MALPNDRQNRIEMFLGAIAGDGSTPPEDPHTRLERYLAYFAGSADSKPDTPYTRLERFLDAIEPGTPSHDLPEDYQEIAYLENTDENQYINTGIKGEFGFDLSFEFTDFTGITSSIYGSIFGSQNASAPYNATLFRATNTQYFFSSFSGGNNIVFNRQNKAHRINGNAFVDKKELYFDSTYYTSPQSGLISDQDLYLFCTNNGGESTTDKKGIKKIFTDAKFYSDVDHTVLIRRYKTCRRKADGVLGMYDTVNKTFTTNSGTGSFTAGPDIVTADEFLNEMEGIL